MLSHRPEEVVAPVSIATGARAVQGTEVEPPHSPNIGGDLHTHTFVSA